MTTGFLQLFLTTTLLGGIGMLRLQVRMLVMRTGNNMLLLFLQNNKRQTRRCSPPLPCSFLEVLLALFSLCKLKAQFKWSILLGLMLILQCILSCRLMLDNLKCRLMMDRSPPK